MMNYKLTAVRTVLPMIMVALFSYTAKSQTITKAASIAYTNGVPIHTPSSAGSEVAINTVNKDFYFWNGTGWVNNTGTGAFVRTTSPTLVTPILGTPTSVTLTNATGLPLSTGVTGTLPVANGGTGTTTPSIVAGTNVTVTGTWPNQTIAAGGGGGTPGGSTTQVQYNNAGTFSGITGATTDGTTLTLTTPVLGAATATSINKVTLTAPATGSTLTIADGKTLTVNNTLTFTGADASSVAFGAGGTVAYQDQVNTFTQNQSNSFTSISATPAQRFTGTWHTGSGTTNTKPHVLIEPAGAVSNAWSTNGTGLGVNAAFGFTGNLIDLQLNGTSRFKVDQNGTGTFGGQLVTGSSITAGTNIATANTGTLLFGGRANLRSPLDGQLTVMNNLNADFERLQFGGITSSFPALQTASFNAQTGLAATFTNGSNNIVTVANTFAAGQVVQFTTTGTLPTGFATGTNYFIVGTPTSTQTGLTATFTNGDANIVTAINAYAAGDVVQFTNSGGALPTGFSLLTNYYVIATGLTTTNIQVSATLGGAAIVPSSAGTGTQTVARQPMFTVSATNGGSAISASSAGSGTHAVVRQNTCIFTNGSSTVTTASAHTLRVGDVIRFSNVDGSLPSTISTLTDYYILSTATTTFTFSSSFGGTATTLSESSIGVSFSGTPNITTNANTFVAGAIVRFSTTGTLPTGLTTSTDYYVLATSLSTTNIQVSATLNGAAISYTGTGSGTHTVARQAGGTQVLGNGIHFFARNPSIYIRTADNSASAALYTGQCTADNITLGGALSTGARINFSSSGTTLADGISWGASQISIYRSTSSTLRIQSSSTTRYLDIAPANTGTTLTVNGNSGSTFMVSAGSNATKSTFSVDGTTGNLSFTNPTLSTTALITATNSNASSTGNLLDLKTSVGSVALISNAGKITLDATITATGNTATQTINKPSGSVNAAASANFVTVNNNLVSTNSIVIPVIATGDTTAQIKNVVKSAGSFTVNFVSAVTAETRVDFVVFN